MMETFMRRLIMTGYIAWGILAWGTAFAWVFAKANSTGLSARRKSWWAAAMGMYLLFTVAGLIAIPAANAHEEEKQPIGMRVSIIDGAGAACVGPIDKLKEMENGTNLLDYPDITCYPLPMDSIYRLARFYEQRI